MPLVNYETAVKEILGLIKCYGGIDGAHHKQWVLDQIVRISCFCQQDETGKYTSNFVYEKWIEEYMDGENGPKTYSWDTGITP
jgi:hypothetical protein